MTHRHQVKKICSNCGHIYYACGKTETAYVKYCSQCTRRFSDSEMEYLIEKCYKNE